MQQEKLCLMVVLNLTHVPWFFVYSLINILQFLDFQGISWSVKGYNSDIAKCLTVPTQTVMIAASMKISESR